MKTTILNRAALYLTIIAISIGSARGDIATKIISSGWGNQDTQYVRDNWQAMDTMPLDGMAVLIAIDRQAWRDGSRRNTTNDLGWQLASETHFKYEQFQPALQDMAAPEFQHLTHNFLTLQTSTSYSTSLTWFDDARWELFLHNLRIYAKLARKMNMKGLIIDVEHYGYPLFNFKYMDKKYADRDYEAYRDQAYRRGIAAMGALNSEYPDISLFFYYSWEMLVYRLQLSENMADQDYALLLPFIEGMLAAATPETAFIIGHEPSYGFKTAAAFEDTRENVMQEAVKLSRHPDKFRKNVKMGFGLWIDNGGKSWSAGDFEKNYFLPAEWEHALGHALRYSDSYVWIYSHHARFFRNPNIPQAYLKAMQRVKADDWQPPDLPERKFKTAGKGLPPVFTTEQYVENNPMYAEEAVFARLLEPEYRVVSDMPAEWRFRKDTESVGIKKQWYAVAYDTDDWQMIEIGHWWEDFGIRYDGYAWYRTRFTVPEILKGQRLWLAFGAVDEAADVFINGIKADSHGMGQNGWNRPFLMEITDSVTYDTENVAAVRVFDSSAYGGIWQNVKLVTNAQ